MKKVIIAETILGAVEKFNSMFGRGGITLYTVRTSEEILDVHRANRADLIITDCNLPVMGGAQLCASLRGNAGLKNVSVIMVCEGPGADVGECRTAGANAVLMKPLDASALFSTVSHLLMVQERLDVRVPLRITVEGKNEKATFVGISRDISVSGMLLEAGRILQQGERLECAFTVNSRVVNINAIVVRAAEGPEGALQYGIKFVNLDAKTFVLLEHFIKSSGAGA